MDNRKRRKLNFRGKLIVSFLFIVLFSGSVYAVYTNVLHQTAEVVANRLAEKMIVNSVNVASEKNNIDLNEIMDCQTDETGRLIGISTDMDMINRWKEMLLSELEETLKNTRYKEKIPLGTLLGNSLTYGKGPDIPLCVTLGGYISADIETQTQSAGINQTKYSVYAEISAKFYTYLPVSGFSVENTTRVFLKEYVIVGEVPSIYTKQKTSG